MNDDPTPPAFFRDEVPNRKEHLENLQGSMVESVSEDRPITETAESATAFPGTDSTIERRYTLSDVFKIMSGLATEDSTRFMLIASALEEMTPEGRKRVLNTLRRLFG